MLAVSDGVGIELSSRLVSKQVLSPQQSLTSVFGMGTGGPSALKSRIFPFATEKKEVSVERNSNIVNEPLEVQALGN